MRTLQIVILTVAFYSAAAQIFGINLKPKIDCMKEQTYKFVNTTEAALLPLMKTVVGHHPALEKDYQEAVQIIKSTLEKVQSVLHENPIVFPISVATYSAQMTKDLLGLLARIAQQLKSSGSTQLADQITQIGKQISASVNKLQPAIAQCLRA
ncbi:unnamed protein product [Caenorhabditis brenneri]